MDIEPAIHVIDGDQSALFDPERSGQPLWDNDLQVLTLQLGNPFAALDELIAAST